ncbi:hypothetical protein WJX72_004355 [[Myrmecia] bisecta]|uniref:Mediator complex subunit 22 n=1 Tax=[Myrmecia] bisecta TaxID=41462 RepID=A0AAW1PXE6_9CHLO
MAITLQRLDADIIALTDNFTNLVKAARIADESDDARRAQVPGDLMEVLAEKIVFAGQSLLALIGDLKRNALLSDFATLNSGTAQRIEAYEQQERASAAQLKLLKREVAETLQVLGEHYQPPKHQGTDPPTDTANDGDEGLRELYQLALDIQLPHAIM